MPLSFQQIVYLVITLLVMAAIFAGVFYAIFWILFQIGRLLYKIPWVSRTITNIRVSIQAYWKRYLPNITRICISYAEMYADLLFYGYALVVFVNRIESFSTYARQNPGSSVFELLANDMDNDIAFYLLFFILFTLWVYSRAWKVINDRKNKKVMRDSLGSIAKSLELMNGNIEKLSRKLDKELQGKDDKQ